MSGMKFEKEIFMKYLIEREASEATKKKYMTVTACFPQVCPCVVSATIWGRKK